MKYKTAIGKSVDLTSERRKHILSKHPELKYHTSTIKKVLSDPDEIRVSKLNDHVLLFYKFFDKILGGKYIVVLIKTNERDFILTSHVTDKIKAGEKYEKEN